MRWTLFERTEKISGFSCVNDKDYWIHYRLPIFRSLSVYISTIFSTNCLNFLVNDSKMFSLHCHNILSKVHTAMYIVTLYVRSYGQWWPMFTYNWFHIKGTFSVHSFNDDYLSIHKCTGSRGYLSHEIPSIRFTLCPLVNHYQ